MVDQCVLIGVKANMFKPEQVGKRTRYTYAKINEVIKMPHLLDIQRKSYEWFLESGLQNIFNDISPIKDNSGNLVLSFEGFSLGEPKYDINECKNRDATYAAPLRVNIRLVNNDPENMDIKEQEVFMGDFPLMTPTGTFIINGAERVIVSQIVRSPGAYFDIATDERSGRDTYTCELIPSRGTWLEFMSDDKKAALGRILNVSIDRRRKVLSTILFKAIGMSLNEEKGEDAFDTTKMKKFLHAMNRDVYDDVVVPEEEREFQNDYMLLYTSVFGNYEEVRNTLAADKTKTSHDALISVYENQRVDEIATVDGAMSLMDAKFFLTLETELFLEILLIVGKL